MAPRAPAPAVEFRTAAPGDVAVVVELVDGAYRGESGREGWTTESDLLGGRRTDEGALRAVIDDPDALVILAERAGTLAACCEIARCGADARFGMFAVRPRLQSTGIGSALLTRAEQTAVQRWGIGSMHMLVISCRRELLAWYGRRGYAPTGETEPFPYGDERFGIPRREDLEFVVLAKRFA
ncbi:MAG TPA: GNAT family N-acetyltransferase [Acidimicrobiales bacterium]|nr:GNAT family N-acetyltransferase [Acidimicrobiales bacterium]